MYSKNKIVQNALAAKALNAKFKVGDMVRIAKGDAGGKTGKVVFASPYGMLKVDVDGTVYVVHEDGVTANAVAKNADDGAKVKVVADTDTLFGKKHEEKVMTVGELRKALAGIGHGRMFADIIREMEAHGSANPYLDLPCEAYVVSLA